MYVYLSLGSNKGCAYDHFRYAVEKLTARAGVVMGISRVYRSPAMYVKDQAMFSNIVVCVKTLLSPTKLLRCLWQIEKEAGRLRIINKGPRTLDMDIVFYGSKRIRHPFLTVPHKEWAERAFVVLPLYDVVFALEPWKLKQMGVLEALKSLSLSDLSKTRPYRREKMVVRRWTDRVGYGKKQCCCGFKEGFC